MRQLRHIVVGHNFFPDGERAVRSACTLAERANAGLYLLHVVEPYPIYQKLRFPNLPAEALLEDVAFKMRTQLHELAQHPDFPQVQVETDVRIGKPFVELITACRRFHSDLIVVGASARDEERSPGSTAERVLCKSPVPVLVARHALAVDPKTIVVPTDFSPCSKQAAKEAVAFVRGFGGRVVFLHVLDISFLYPAVSGVELSFIPPVTSEDLQPEWQEFLQDLPLAGLSWEKQTRDGRAGQTIVDVAAEMSADLIVIGTHGRTGLAHLLLGSVAEKVVRTAACSVLTVRPEAFQFELP